MVINYCAEGLGTWDVYSLKLFEYIDRRTLMLQRTALVTASRLYAHKQFRPTNLSMRHRPRAFPSRTQHLEPCQQTLPAVGTFVLIQRGIGTSPCLLQVLFLEEVSLRRSTDYRPCIYIE